MESFIEWGLCRCSRQTANPSPLRIRETVLRLKRIAKTNIALEDLKREPAPKNDQTFTDTYTARDRPDKISLDLTTALDYLYEST